MSNIPKFSRPPFSEALSAWKTVLAEHHLPTDLIWIFDENLCFEKDSAAAGGFELGFQTRFAPPPTNAAQVGYDFFCKFEARLVLYRMGSCRGKSVCLLLCDGWFESKAEKDGFLRRDEWLMSFRPGAKEESEEITEEQRWQERILRDRPLHDLDFCMTLKSVHELLAHGRVLSTYEHYALRLLHSWHRLLGGRTG